MKRYNIFIIILSFVVMHMHAGRETFLRANHLYKSKDYQQAFDLYNGVKRKGPAVWHNMGNCAFKLNKHVDALVYWRRAQRDATSAEFQALENNIATANEILGREQKCSFFDRIINFFPNRFSLVVLQLLFLFFWFVFFGVTWMVRQYRWVVLVLLVPLNVVFGGAVVQKYRTRSCLSALVIKAGTLLFAGPDNRYHIVGSVNLADELQVIERRDAWCKVRDKHLVGWTLVDTIKIV